jgi:hypothetical protein
MDLAVRTTASPAAIWVICVVAVACLAFWLIMVMVVAPRPDPRLRRVAAISGSVAGGIPMAAGGTGIPAAGRPQVPVQREPRAPAEAGAAGTAAEAPTEQIPTQRTRAGDAAPTDPAGSGTGERP